ncbi:ribosomal protein S4E [Pedobacter sp. W3I1]|uniref:KOW motif-containing protein n=1 Tax=Pedobacter sp. W3I1 TaxID=3042291 RepID=UPI00277DDAF7|nr:KOW motif-containing protein [Pedobacter sp. W3I1]MDQ0638910.1 ribosomal protein S4E [Pedobacter sp. W3I1]
METINLKDGDQCIVVKGTHAGKFGRVSDINTSKTGHITITVEQDNAVKFKTLGRNVVLRDNLFLKNQHESRI